MKQKIPEIEKEKFDESLNWPEAVPILSGEDIVKGDFYGEKSACLLIHIQRNFPDPEVRAIVRNRFEKYINSMTDCGFGIMRFNDDYATKKLCADLWNKVIEDFGYL